MSLSRPATFPLLKLPFLCIECVIKNWDTFDMLFFALFSRKTRQLVKNLKIPLNGIRILVRESKWIELGRKRWKIMRTNSQALFEEHPNFRKNCLMLKNKEISLYISKTDCGFESFTDGNEITAVKIAMEFLIEVFKCSVEKVNILDDNFSESGDIGATSTVDLTIDRRFCYARSQQLSLLLENLEVTGTCNFWMNSTEKEFYVDPKIFKCKKLMFYSDFSWVTREILMQFEVPQLHFYYCPFSAVDILSFVTNWFHSDNKKLEYLYIEFRSRHVSLEKFQTEELNPLPFSKRTRVPLSESFKKIDFSKGLEIVRHDGLPATIHVEGEDFMFYIWHNQ